MVVEFTKEQAQALLGLLDLAVKTGGLKVASTAAFFHQTLENAAQRSAVESKPVPAEAVDEASKP